MQYCVHSTGQSSCFRAADKVAQLAEVWLISMSTCLLAFLAVSGFMRNFSSVKGGAQLIGAASALLSYQ
jgi:hypothetical protein